MAFEAELSQSTKVGASKRMKLDPSVLGLASVAKALEGSALGRGHSTARNAVARDAGHSI